MKYRNKESGFTLLEVIIVIIIIGVLASLALPRFFSTVEYSKSSEAMSAFVSLHSSLDRFYAARNTYTGVTMALLDVENPGNVPGAHFSYAVASGASAYTVTATRTTYDGGTGGSVLLTFNGTTITRFGTGPFGAIQ